MSKYDPLWNSISQSDRDSLKLSFEDIRQILGFPIDHAFCDTGKSCLTMDGKCRKSP